MPNIIKGSSGGGPAPLSKRALVVGAWVTVVEGLICMGDCAVSGRLDTL